MSFGCMSVCSPLAFLVRGGQKGLSDPLESWLQLLAVRWVLGNRLWKIHMPVVLSTTEEPSLQP